MGTKKSSKLLLVLSGFVVLGMLASIFIYQRERYLSEVHNLRSSLMLERLNAITFQNQMLVFQAQQIEENAKSIDDLSRLSLLTYSNPEYRFRVKFPDLWLYREEKPNQGPLKLSVIINSTRGDNYFIEVYEPHISSYKDFFTSYYVQQGYKVSDWKEDYISNKKVFKFYTEYTRKAENTQFQNQTYSFGNFVVAKEGYLYSFSSSRGRTPQEKLSNPFLESMVSSLEFTE